MGSDLNRLKQRRAKNSERHSQLGSHTVVANRAKFKTPKIDMVTEKPGTSLLRHFKGWVPRPYFPTSGKTKDSNAPQS